MSWQSKSAAVAIAIMAMSLHSSSVQAMPEQGKVVAGQGEIARPDDKTMVINQKTDRLALDWQKFNIAKDEKVHFDQNSKSAIAINRVVGDGRSIIDGSLSATGNVFVINPNGVLFGKNSSVDVGGLVASTSNVTDEDMRNFTQGKGDLGLQIAAGREASVINAGTIKAEGGLVALHATTVENTGTIANEGGTTALAAAKNLNIAADTAGKLNFTVNGSLANAKALNSGTLQSDGGYIVMTAKSAGDVMSTVVNNTGIIEAKTLHTNDKGEILLDGGASGQVEVSGTLNASGMETGQSAGSIKVIGQKTIINDGTNLLARGMIDGGKIETSGDVLNLGNNLNIDAKGVNGNHGEWLLDPLEVLIQDDSPTLSKTDQSINTVNEGSETQINYNDPPSETQNANATYSSTSWIKTSLITDILNKGTDVTIQAASTSQAASITVNSAINPKVGGDGEATLEFDAQRNITINKEIKADATGGKLNIRLNSDTDGDGVGAVIINADISTNGGDFTSGSGGKVKFTAPTGTDAGAYAATGIDKDTKPNIAGHTVGTYFGYVVPEGKSAIDLSGEQNNRKITTNGGTITLNGEVAIGLNGGILTLDTSKKDGTTGGEVNITGIINSGNSYDTYIYGTKKWDELVKDEVQEYLDHNTVPSYHFVGINYTKNADGTYSYTKKAKTFNEGESHYAFHELKPGDVKGSNWTYPDSEPTLDTQHTRWYATTTAGTGYNSFIMEGTTPETSQMSIDEWLIYYRRTDPDNYATKYANGNKDTTKNLVTYDQIKNDPTRLETLKSDISALIAHNWFASKTLANPRDKSGANPGDSYLATITTALENSLTTPNSQKTLWVGGMGSGVRNKNNDITTNPYSQYPVDPNHKDGFYWVTGPEGLVTNADGTTGTKFWDVTKSYWNKDPKQSNYGEQVYGYTKWSSWTGGGQPDNSAPFLTVGYGNNNAWDDAAIDGGTTVGFVQETNLYNSSLNIKTGGGDAMLQGDIGKSVGLDTVSIDAGTGSVTTGNKANNATQYNHGTIYADHGVYINGKDVTIGGEIHSGGTDVEATKNTEDSFKDYLDNVTINSAGNLTVHGIEVNSSTDSKGNTTSRTDGEGGKVKLTSTGTAGVITLGDGVDYNGKNTNGGVLKTASTANDAVVIDAQGTKSKFVNETTSTKAIDTQGKWKIYSASPDLNTFSTNLNSGTDAMWDSTSKSFDVATAADTNSDGTQATGKYIFQVQPTITVSGANTTKTYGVNWDDKYVKENLISYTASYTNSDNEIFDVKTGKDKAGNAFTNAFQEKDYTNYISNKDESVVGEENMVYKSLGAPANADREQGDKVDSNGTPVYAKSDNAKAVYNLSVKTANDDVKAIHGYNLKTVDGSIEITKRKVTVGKDGHITYGSDKDITYDAAPSVGPSKDTEGLMTGDTIGTVTMTPSSEYQNSKGTKNTGDAGQYKMTTDATQTTILNNGKDVSINYDISGKGTLTVDPATLTLDTGSTTKDYGDVDGVKKFLEDGAKNYILSGFVNGDDKDIDKQNTIRSQITNVTNTSNALVDATHTNNVLDGGNRGYDIKTEITQSPDLKNYKVVVKEGNTVTLKPVVVTINGGMTQTYGDDNETKATPGITTTVNGKPVTGLVNGDTLGDVSYEIKSDGNYNKSKGNRKTADAREYYDEWLTRGAVINHGDLTNQLGTEATGNYIVTGKGDINVEKATLTVNAKDFTQTYGNAEGVLNDAKTAYEITGFVNGDDAEAKKTALENNITVTMDATDALQDGNKHTKDANANAKTGYINKVVSATGNLANGELDNYVVTVGKTADIRLNPATLVVDTADGSRAYGDTTGVVSDLDTTKVNFHLKDSDAKTTNGDNEKDIFNALGLKVDSPALIRDKDGNPLKTNNVNENPGYDVEASFNHQLSNYVVETGKVGKEKITPKDVYFHVTGNGKTIGDVVYTVTDTNPNPDYPLNPNDPINSQLVYGETVTPSYRPDGRLPDGHYGVSTSLPGYGPIESGNVYGNYRYHYDGDVTVSMPNKPDLPTPVNPPVTPGTGTVTPLPEQPTNPSSNTPESTTETTGHKTVWDGERDRGGDRPEDKRVVTLPFFKVLEDKTTHRYGTYDVAKRTTEVKIEPSAQVLPEPNQPATQYRELTTELTTDKGTGEFTLKYNGSRFTILPDDDAAMKLIVVGDETKNRALFEKALHVAFTQMGLEVADLDGVYIHFGKD